MPPSTNSPGAKVLAGVVPFLSANGQPPVGVLTVFAISRRVVESVVRSWRELSGAARPDPFVGADRCGGAGEVGHDEDVAHLVEAGNSPVGVRADRVLEEPEAERGGAVVGVAVGAEIDDRVGRSSADRHTVSGGEDVGDVSLVLRRARRCARRDQPLIQIVDVLGRAAGEDVIVGRIHRVVYEGDAAGDRAAGVLAGVEDGVVVDLVPVVRGLRRRVAIELEEGAKGRRDAGLEPFQAGGDVTTPPGRPGGNWVGCALPRLRGGQRMISVLSSSRGVGCTGPPSRRRVVVVRRRAVGMHFVKDQARAEEVGTLTSSSLTEWHPW